MMDRAGTEITVGCRMAEADFSYGDSRERAADGGEGVEESESGCDVAVATSRDNRGAEAHADSKGVAEA